MKTAHYNSLQASTSDRSTGLAPSFYSCDIKVYSCNCTQSFINDTSCLGGEGERITFLEWLKSISEPTERGAERVKRDLLSPPRFTEKEYSMGAVPIVKIPHLHTLIEARGYCDVEITSPSSMQHRQPISIDNVDKLINDEAGKFFTLAKGEVK